MNNKNKNKKSINNNKSTTTGDFDDILSFINGNNNQSTTTPPPTIQVAPNQQINSVDNSKALYDEKLKIINKLFDDNNPKSAQPIASKSSKFTPKPTPKATPIRKTTNSSESSGITFYDNAKNYLSIIKEKELPLETLLKLNKIAKPTTNNNKSTSSTNNSNTNNKEKENYGYIDPKTINSITDEEAIQLFKLFSKTKNEVGRIFIAFQFYIFHQNRNLSDKNEYANFISKVLLDESPLVNACGKKIIVNEGTGKSESNSLILNQIYSSKDKLQSIFKDLPVSSVSVQSFKNNIKSILNLVSNPNDPSSNMNLLSSVIFYQKVFENNPPTTAGQYCFLEFYYNELKNGLTLSTYYCDVVDLKIQDLIKFKHLNDENNISTTTATIPTNNNNNDSNNNNTQ